MSGPRLTAKIWVEAYLRRLDLATIPAFVTRKGDPTAGAVLIKVATLDGTAVCYQRSWDLETGARTWVVLADGAETEVDAALSRQTGFDPDIWVIEVESRDGTHLLDEDGLA